MIDESITRVILFDVDGTLANGDHRYHLYEGRDSDSWAAYIAACIQDSPYTEVQWLNYIISQQPNVYIIVLTARSESGREVTEKWLMAHGIIYDELIMKPEDEAIVKVKDHDFKERILDELILQNKKPFMVFEDRKSVVDMFRSKGIPVLQVRPGDV
jgi:phosphoglycolate phosphatase-like HAD superfamily hydrolase